MAVAERRLDDSEAELRRLRDRIHDVDSVVDAVRLLTQGLQDLPARLEQIAEQVATRIVTAALSARDATERDDLEDRRQGLSVRTQIVAVVIAANSLGVAVVLAFRTLHG